LGAADGLQRVEVPVLLGEQDHIVPPADREEVGNALRASGVRHEIVVYPDTPRVLLRKH
jgi:carboxymethylenebutenolidase